MTFRVGQKVVCVAKARPRSWRGRLECWLHPYPGEMPVVGRVYEIENITPADHLELRGVFSPSDEYWEAGFLPQFFRSIVESKSQTSFTHGADPSSDRFDNRRKIRVRA